MKLTKRRIGHIVIGLIFLALLAVVKAFGLTEYMSLAWLQEHLQELHTFIDEHYVAAVFIFLVSYITASALSIPGSTLFITASGLLFGMFGALYSLIGAAVGAMILFFTTRYVVGEWAQHKYEHKLAKFNQAFQKRGVYYLLLVRLLALLPFCMINALSGITLVRAETFLWTTVIGMIPYIVLYTFTGMQLSTVTAQQGWLSPPMLAFVGTVGFRMVLLPFLVQHVLRVRREYKV